MGLTTPKLSKYRSACGEPSLVLHLRDMRRYVGAGRYLASLRLAAGLDLVSAAARSGITPERLSAIEEDRVDPWFMEVVRMAATYECPIGEISKGWDLATAPPTAGSRSDREGDPR